MENFRSMSCREGRMQMESYSYGAYNNNHIYNINGDEENRGNIDDNNNNINNVPSNYPTSMQDLRSYSTSYASSANYYGQNQNPHQVKSKKSQVHNNNNGKNSHGKSSSSSKGGWNFADPEMQRKKRVASYKVYAVEGKMKGSLRKSFRWIKQTFSNAVHGW